jgi:hypothetical protein
MLYITINSIATFVLEIIALMFLGLLADTNNPTA